MGIQQGKSGIHFLFLEKKKGKRSHFDQTSKKIAWAPKTRKSVILQLEFNWENLAYIFLFLDEQKRNMKQFCQQMKTFVLF